MHRLVLFSLLHTLSSLSLALDCRPPGPVVPRPRNLTQSPLFQTAIANLTATFDAANDGKIYAGWPTVNTSFSVGLITLDQPNRGQPAWEYHYLAPNNVNGTKNLTRKSQYLIGSISKVITDYILLKSGLDLDSSITRYLPELATNSSRIQWQQITLRDLASQLAGIPPNYGFSEYYYLRSVFLSLGFPAVPDSAYAPCGVEGLNGGCSRPRFLDGMVEYAGPVAAPAEHPVYSNIAFTLLAYAVQNATGLNYTQQLRRFVTEPLGMASTVESPGLDAQAVIPPVQNSWGANYADNAPGGGLVSTLADLSTFFHGILSRSILDTPAEVRAWLKPASSTGSAWSLVGMPWEIYRSANLTPAHPHTVDLYAKGGAAYGYQSQAVVIDEYGVAMVVMTAGSAKAVTHVYDALLTSLVPVIDQVARDQADKYAGCFLESQNSGNVSFNASIVQDQDSLLLHSLERNGTDILNSIREIWAYTIGGFLDIVPDTPRLYPTEIKSPGVIVGPDGENKTVTFQDWRIDWVFQNDGKTDLPGFGFTDNNCLSWTVLDWLYYGNEPVDRIIFVLDAKSDEVLGIEVPFLRSELLRSVNHYFLSA